MIARDGSRPSSDPKDQDRPGKQVTVWLYPESGIARCDGAASNMDIIHAMERAA